MNNNGTTVWAERAQLQVGKVGGGETERKREKEMEVYRERHIERQRNGELGEGREGAI